MKKKFGLLSITLLCGSVLATTALSVSNVYAQGVPTVDSSADEASNEELVAQLQAAIDAAKPYVDYTKYEKNAVDTLALFISFGEDDIKNGYIAADTVATTIDMIQGQVNIVKNSPLEGSVSSTTEDTSSSSSASTIPSSSEPEISSSESTSSSSSESETSSSESTSSSSSASSTTESSTQDTTTADSSSEIKPTINVTDKIMYVGDKLTEEDILNWATFENAEGLQVGFEVVGEPIQVLELDNTLVEPGVHQIKFYVEGKARALENPVAEKTITLTVKAKDGTITSSDTTGTTATTDPSGTVTKPVGKTTPISSASTTNSLPQTGESNSVLLTVLGGMTLVAGAYVLNLKRKKNN